MQTENSSYFVASRHKLSAFFSLIFRFSSCHHPLIASALAKIVDDHDNRTAIGKDENAVRQLISMISSEDRHVVSEIFFMSKLCPCHKCNVYVLEEIYNVWLCYFLGPADYIRGLPNCLNKWPHFGYATASKY